MKTLVEYLIERDWSKDEVEYSDKDIQTTANLLKKFKEAEKNMKGSKNYVYKDVPY